MYDESDLPRYLYKYRAADRFSLDLFRGEVYFAPHWQLNDPTDLYRGRSAKLQYAATVADLEEEIERLKEEAQAYQKVYEEMHEMYVYLQSEADDMPPMEWLEEIASEKIAEIDRLLNKPAHRGHPKTLRSLGKAFERKFELLHSKMENLERLKQTWEDWQEENPPDTFINRMSVLCLTTDSKNYRMWSRYADGFRGVCIGFDQDRLTECLLRSEWNIVGPVRVQYRNISIEKQFTPRFYLDETNLYKYKPTEFRREKEVRFVRRDGFGIVYVPVSCIKVILFGDRVDGQFRQSMMDEIQRCFTEYDDLAVYQATGDAAGQVHIERDRELHSLMDEWRYAPYESTEQEIEPHQSDVEPERNPFSEEDEIPF